VATAGDDAGERDGSGSRCQDGVAELGPDVDAPVLACGVRVRADGERTQHRPFRGPGPGERTGRECQGCKRDDDHHYDNAGPRHRL
jgi:hypothetical protein